MPAWGVRSHILDGEGHQRRGPAQPAVVGRGGRQVREQVAQPLVGEPQPATFRTAPEQDLGHGQTDQLGVAELGLATGALSGPEPVIDGDVQCRDEGVEVGAHEASQEVDVAFATPTLGALASLVTARHPQADSEAII